MSLVGFICPDGAVCDVETCLSGCRMDERCLTVPTLSLMSSEREWAGTASTTQLLNGTMHEYLKLTNDYVVDPQSRVFMIAGTIHHGGLEERAKLLGLPAEIAMSVDRNIIDLIEVEPEGLVLTDYKLWGSFKVAKALGIIADGKMPDPSGACYKSNGKWGKIGDPKMVTRFKTDPEQADNWEAELQLNRYRLMLELYGLKLQRMQLQVTVRDGGLFVAHNRGVFLKAIRIPIPKLDDEAVRQYFKLKADALAHALEYGWMEPCNFLETWNGRRCADYCDVNTFCPIGQIALAIKEADNA